jgi:hypothetical protein
MKTIINPKNTNDMKLLKFLAAAIAGFGLVKLFGFFTEEDFDNEREDIYDEEDHPLFV